MIEETRDYLIGVYEDGKWIGNVAGDGTDINRLRIHSIQFTKLRAHEIADQMKQDNPQYEFAPRKAR